MIEHPQGGVDGGENELDGRNYLDDGLVGTKVILNSFVEGIVNYIDQNGKQHANQDGESEGDVLINTNFSG